MNPIPRRVPIAQDRRAEGQSTNPLVPIVIKPAVELLSIRCAAKRLGLAKRVRGIAKRALAGRSQKPKIAAGACCPLAGTVRPVALVLMLPAYEGDCATQIIEMRRRLPHHQLRNRIAAHPRILKHQAGLWRNDEGRIGDD